MKTKKIVVIEVMLLVSFILIGSYFFTLNSAIQTKKNDSSIDNQVGYFKINSQYGIGTNPVNIDLTKENLFQTLTNTYQKLLDSELNIYNISYTQIQDNTNNISVMCNMMGSKAIATACIKEAVEEGNLIDGDFVLKSENECIPIMIGNSYKDNYKIGQKISARLYGENVELIVSAILKKDTKYSCGIVYDDFDEGIIMPAIQFGYPVSSEEEYSFRNEILNSENLLYVKYDEAISYEECVQIANKIIEESGMCWECGKQIRNEFADTEFTVTQTQSQLYLKIVLIMFSIASIGIIILNKRYIENEYEIKNIKKYPIQIITRHIVFYGIFVTVCYKIVTGIIGYLLKKSVFYNTFMNEKADICICLLIYFIIRCVWETLFLDKKLKKLLGRKEEWVQ